MRPASRRRPCSEYGPGGWSPLRMGGRAMVTYSPRCWRTPPPLPLHSLKGAALLVVPMNLEEIQVAEPAPLRERSRLSVHGRELPIITTGVTSGSSASLRSPSKEMPLRVKPFGRLCCYSRYGGDDAPFGPDGDRPAGGTTGGRRSVGGPGFGRTALSRALPVRFRHAP